MADNLHSSPSFALSDDDYNALCSLRDQLGFIGNLLGMDRFKQQLPVTSEQLHAFIHQLENAADAVVSAVTDRRASSAPLDADAKFDWMLMLDHFSGRRFMNQTQKRRLTQRLENAAGTDPDMREIYDLWVAYLTKDGEAALSDVLADPPPLGNIPAPNAKPSRSRTKLISPASA
ncbi:UNVERIFIED_ORG: hypothetical protein LHJ69_00430 [Shinella sp. XGS7]|nr:hypothetical protein [Shinella sp. XGS7]